MLQSSSRSQEYYDADASQTGSADLLDTINLHLRQEMSAPRLTRKQEIELATEIQECRTTWRAQLLESPAVQRLLLEYYRAVCMEEKSVLSFSRDARTGADKQDGTNSIEAIRSGMKKDLPELERLCTMRDQALEKSAWREVGKRAEEARTQINEMTVKIRMLFECNPVRERWFVDPVRKGGQSPLEVLRTMRGDMQRRPRNLTDERRLMRLAGETPESLERRLEYADAVHTSWSAAKQHMVLANLGLVFATAESFKERGVSLFELVQEGSIGLMEAVDRYEVERGFKFSTYATWWIQRYVRDAQRDGGRMIAIPGHRWQQIGAIRDALARGSDGKALTKEEIARVVGVDHRTMTDLLRTGHALSIDAPTRGNEDIRIRDGIADTIEANPIVDLIEAEAFEGIHQMLGALTSRERDVLSLRYGLGIKWLDDGNTSSFIIDPEKRSNKKLTLKEVGKQLGLTGERIRQIETAALRKLKKIICKQACAEM